MPVRKDVGILIYNSQKCHFMRKPIFQPYESSMYAKLRAAASRHNAKEPFRAPNYLKL
jgi:hypothetical protein